MSNLDDGRLTLKKEKDFRSNPWKFAKSICQGKSEVKPSFSKEECFSYFTAQYSNPSSQYQGLPEWAPQVMHPPNVETDFDLSPITPRLVKTTLQKCSSSSSPGPDSISYLHLRQLPSCHHFLATLFSKIILQKAPGPRSWYSGKITLIHKAGNPSLPANFRPIALTSCIGKIFHKIIAKRLERYIVSNEIVDVSTQKGFISGINGTMEHTFTLNSLLENAKANSLPIFVTFLDLKNAFGSVPHALILDMLQHIRLPSEMISYVADCYSKLQAKVSTENWQTSHFPVQRGIFQGDTLSPLLFLIAFQPILHLAASLEMEGYQLLLPIPESEGLPPPDSYIYILWDEVSSDEPQGWYLCQVMEYYANGLAKVKYLNSSAIEIISLKSTPWHFTRKSAKKFLPPEATPPKFPLKRVREQALQPKSITSSSRKVKAFADDLTVISRSLSSHQKVLETTVIKCKDMDLQVRPDKCVSILYNGKKVLDDSSVQLPSGSTNSIRAAPTKFLGGYVGHTHSATRKAASTRLLKVISKALDEIDKQPIRAEYKCWTLKHYLAPSLHLYLAIEDIPEETIKQVQAKVNKIVKKWLNLPRSATLAALYHPTVLGLPFFPHLRPKAKVDYLRAITTTSDPLLQELAQSFSTQNLPSSIPPASLDLLKSARESIKDLPPSKPALQLKHATRKVTEAHQVTHWDNHLDTLSVQSQFKDIVILEGDCKIWSRIQSGLPAGQLSFLLKAGTDCLPTPLNLCRWKIQTDPKCPLCSWPQPTTKHILNGCPTALNQGRYTWRHDSVLQTFAKALVPALSPSETLYADLPGLTASNNPPATIPTSLSTTSDRPDLVIVSGGDVHILELTIPANTIENLNEARHRKQAKYQPLIEDLESHPRTMEVSYCTIEVGSLGHYPPSAIQALRKACPSLAKNEAKDIMAQAAKVAVGCSYYIFRARPSKDWDSHKTLYTLL